jgi:PAS domain S-box-containing protein
MNASKQAPHERAHRIGAVEAEAVPCLQSEQAQQLAERALRESGQLLEAMLQSDSAVVCVKDVRGRYLLVNQRYAEAFEVTREEVVGRTNYDLFPAQAADAFRANDERVLAAGMAMEFEEVVAQRDGVHTYISVKFPIAGPTGPAYAICAVSTDITERRLAQRRLLAEHAVTRALNVSARLAEAAPQILQAICENLGWEVGMYWEVDAVANELRCVEVWHEPGLEIAAFEQLSRQTTFPPGMGFPGRIWAGGRPLWASYTSADANLPRAPVALSEGLRTACGFPIQNGHSVLGVLESFHRAAREPDENLLAMMGSVGSQIGQFVERVRAQRTVYAHERELAVARSIQRGLLPKAAPRLAGFEMGGDLHSAQKVGGDYLDYVPLADQSLGIVIGDASGHGMPAALLIAATRAYVRALLRREHDPGRLLTLVNRCLADDFNDCQFVTMLLARLDPRTRTFVYANAGHSPGYVLGARGEVKAILDSTGFPLGLDKFSAVPTAPVVTLDPGDLVLLFTDGVVEAPCKNDQLFGVDRAIHAVRLHLPEPPAQIVAALFDSVRKFTGGHQQDDMTAIVIKVGGSTRPA